MKQAWESLAIPVETPVVRFVTLSIVCGRARLHIFVRKGQSA
ncbi:hypothetical protein ACFL17_02855 [Pseudomonadota bacterium]